MPRILVIRGGALGDFILTLPAIRLLRDSIPEARIEILGYKPIIDLALAAGVADSTRSLDHGAMARLFVSGAQIEAGLQEYFRSFELVVSYLFDPDGILRGNMESMGVKTFIEASHRVEPGRGHAAEQLARPLERLAMFLEDAAPRLRMPPAAGDGGGGEAGMIAVHPGSGSPRKNWPVENWRRLGVELARGFPSRRLALVTGEAEAERGITREMIEAWGALEFEHWDMLDLSTLAGRLAGCGAFLGHDSGISHLAAACGVPCLLLFGPTDPATWAPRNAGVRVLRAPDGDLGGLGFGAVWEEARGFVAQLPEK